MSERDAVALAWAILVSLAIAGAVPASWAVVGFPAIYLVTDFLNWLAADRALAIVLWLRDRGGRR